MNGLSFANPEWFWALLLLLPPLALRIRSQWRARHPLTGLVSPRLRGRLVGAGGAVRRWTVFTLQMLALAATVVALARPQLGFDEVETHTEARNLIIAVDTSRSMLADDLAPNRLSRARFAAKEIVRSLPGDRIGVIAFAGKPFLQAPLTVDHEAVLESIDQLDTEIIPRGGTNLAAAADLALETFDEADLEQSALLVFSDGESLEGKGRIETVRAKAARQNMVVIAVGVGTEDGSIIPELDEFGDPVPGSFVEDDEGQVVRSRLDPEALRSLASDGGIYVHLGGQASLSRVVNQIRQSISASREQSGARLRPIERFPWPLSFALLCLVLSHAAPLLMAVKSRPRPASPIPASGAAALPIGLFFSLLATPVSSAADALREGHEAFQQEDYESAIETWESGLRTASGRDVPRLHMGIGAAAFRRGDYERAIDAYGRALTDESARLREHAHYNLGNTLYRRGEAALQGLQRPSDPDQPRRLSSSDTLMDATIRQWESAVEHYETVLNLNGENERAAHNLEVVKKRLEELEKKRQEQEKQEEEQEKDEKEEEEEKEDEKEEDQQREQQQNQGGEGKNQDQNPDQDQQNQQNQQDSESDSSGQEGDTPPENQDQDGEKQEDEGPGDSREQDAPSDPSESPDSPSDEDREGDSPGERKRPDPADAPPPEKQEAPGDGKLEANPNQSQPNPSQPNQSRAGEATPSNLQRNPETGYSPSQARQLLEALADETEVRPLLRPSGGENYKNW